MPSYYPYAPTNGIGIFFYGAISLSLGSAIVSTPYIQSTTGVIFTYLTPDILTTGTLSLGAVNPLSNFQILSSNPTDDNLVMWCYRQQGFPS